MIVVHSPSELRTWIEDRRRQGRSIGFVPTMGALHEGHRRLIEVSRRADDETVVSIFVNRLQFDDPLDFARYPTTLEDDCTMCSTAGVSVVWAPSTDHMYPTGFSTSVHIGSVGEILEGRSRPGHFAGVATVVAKLLNTTRPDRAYFGAKDFQQVAVVRRMVRDLDIGTDVVVVPTVRDQDGLALSSRNRRLTSDARRRALAINRALVECHDRWTNGERSIDRLEETMRTTMVDAGLGVDYAVVVDAETLLPPESPRRDCVALVAVVCDEVRLIDNVLLPS